MANLFAALAAGYTMSYTIQMRDRGRWRLVRHVIPSSLVEAMDLQGWLHKWNLGIFRVVEFRNKARA